MGCYNVWKTANGSAHYCISSGGQIGQCIDEKNIPTFTYQKYVISHTEAMFNNKHQAIVTDINVVKPYHVVDEKCRLLDACKEGCKKCKERFSDQCTECEEDYYRHDYGYQVKKESFKCYTKDTCIGIAPNPFVKDRWEGGVNVLEDGEKVCLNCKIRNGTCRLPENDFYCGNEINRTFVDGSLRGQGIAGKLMDKVYLVLKEVIVSSRVNPADIKAIGINLFLI